MKYTIIWSNFSEKQLDEIFEYYCNEVNKRTAKKIIKQILAEPKILENNPFLGQIENLLIHRKISYRYLVCNNYKIIYSVDENEYLIKIADVFNTLQNPIKINRNE